MKKTFVYTLSLIKGLAVTIKYFFGPPITLQYPKERWSPPQRYRGRVSLRPGKCVSCQMCQKACPNKSLEVKFSLDQNKKRRLSAFIYRLDTCLYCGLCVEPCPREAIFMNHEYELSVYERKELIVDLLEKDKDVE